MLDEGEDVAELGVGGGAQPLVRDGFGEREGGAGVGEAVEGNAVGKGTATADRIHREEGRVVGVEEVERGLGDADWGLDADEDDLAATKFGEALGESGRAVAAKREFVGRGFGEEGEEVGVGAAHAGLVLLSGQDGDLEDASDLEQEAAALLDRVDPVDDAHKAGLHVDEQEDGVVGSGKFCGHGWSKPVWARSGLFEEKVGICPEAGENRSQQSGQDGSVEDRKGQSWG